MEDDESRRAERAQQRRESAFVRVVPPGDRSDPQPVKGEAAMALRGQLSALAWSLSGGVQPHYARHEIPVRVVGREVRRAP